MLLSILLSAAAVFCAYRVMRAGRLLHVTLWLALTSALVSVLLYQLGAPEVAVMELSVGAGLVTVLFVYAFAIVGEATFDEITSLPRPLTWALILGVSGLLGWLVLPAIGGLGGQSGPDAGGPAAFSRVLWEQRGLDVIAQVVLIFSGVMGLLGLLSETRTAIQPGIQVHQPAAAQPAAAQPAAPALDLAGGQRVPLEELAALKRNGEDPRQAETTAHKEAV
ncbi:MAG: NADH-quinone oxidoreductase subunit J [Chloroflexota bacterium]